MLSFNVNGATSGLDPFALMNLKDQKGNLSSITEPTIGKREIQCFYGDEKFGDFNVDSEDDDIPMGDLFDEELVGHQEEEEDFYSDDEADDDQEEDNDLYEGDYDDEE